MFNFFKKKPVAIIQISRLTATEETTHVTVNAYKLDRHVIYKAMQEAGEALRFRLIENNQIAMKCAEQEINEDKAQDINEFAHNKKKGK